MEVTLDGAVSCISGRDIDLLGPLEGKFPPMAPVVLYPDTCVLLHQYCTHVLISENLSYYCCIFIMLYPYHASVCMLQKFY